MRAVALIFGMLACLYLGAQASFSDVLRPARIAVIDFGTSPTGLRAAVEIQKAFSTKAPDKSVGIVLDFEAIDADQVRAAALGAGYDGSLNMTVQQARDLGAAIGCDFYFVGEAQTVRRSPSTGASYYESYTSIFLLSAR